MLNAGRQTTLPDKSASRRAARGYALEPIQEVIADFRVSLTVDKVETKCANDHRVPK